MSETVRTRSDYQQMTNYENKVREVVTKLAQFVQQRGGTWVHFSQHVWLNGQELGHGGVCGALAVIFLARYAEGRRDFLSYVCSEPGRKAVMAAWAISGDTLGLEDTYLTNVGLTRRYARYNDYFAEMPALMDVTGYYDITLSTLRGQFNSNAEAQVAAKKSDAHAIAAVRAAESIVFYDPNFGIAFFKGADAIKSTKALMGKLWKDHYDSFKGLSLLSRFS